MSVGATDLFCLYPTPRGHVAALRGLTLDVRPGERVLVHGPNGSGKTTLMRVLAGEQAPSAGRVSVCGVDLIGATERDRAALRARSLGVVTQSGGRALRPELTVRDNVALHLRLSGTPAAGARAAATELLADLGLEALAGRRPQTLSGGEAQRAAVCAAVAHRPSLVLADEPTGELDRRSAEDVHDLLVAVTTARGAALLLVSHDRQAERIADRIVRIRDGRISEEWGPGEASDESLVVDDRGWVRLPEPLRRAAGTGDRLRAEHERGRIVLRAASGSADRSGVSTPGEIPSPLDLDTILPAPRSPARVPAPVDYAPAGSASAGSASAGSAGLGATEVRGGPAYPVIVASARSVGLARGDRRILAGADLDAAAGRLVAVRGRSGSGKTTLLRILAGLDRADEGEVTVAGIPLSTLDRAGLARMRRHHVAIAGQDTALLEAADVTENIALARAVRDLPEDPDIIAACIEALGLSGVRHRPVRVLSGGERQRVALSRVFAAQRRLAVLDEPTSHQDETNAEHVVAALRAATTVGVAVVAATHDPILIAAADEIVTLGE